MKKILASALILTMLSSTGAICFAFPGGEMNISSSEEDDLDELVRSCSFQNIRDFLYCDILGSESVSLSDLSLGDRMCDSYLDRYSLSPTARCGYVQYVSCVKKFLNVAMDLLSGRLSFRFLAPILSWNGVNGEEEFSKDKERFVLLFLHRFLHQDEINIQMIFVKEYIDYCASFYRALIKAEKALNGDDIEESKEALDKLKSEFESANRIVETRQYSAPQDYDKCIEEIGNRIEYEYVKLLSY